MQRAHNSLSGRMHRRDELIIERNRTAGAHGQPPGHLRAGILEFGRQLDRLTIGHRQKLGDLYRRAGEVNDAAALLQT